MMRKTPCRRVFNFTLVVFAFGVLALSTGSFAQVGISVSFGPPALPVYEQPVCPGEGYIWTPGSWAWDEDDGGYYRVAARERHVPPVRVQTEHFRAARTNPQLRASANQGKPPVAATARPAEFRSAIPARAAGAPYHPPANRAGGQSRNMSGRSGPAVH